MRTEHTIAEVTRINIRTTSYQNMLIIECFDANNKAACIYIHGADYSKQPEIIVDEKIKQGAQDGK